MDAVRDFFLPAKFIFNELVIVEFIIRQVQSAGVGMFRPAGRFIGAATGAGFRIARNVRAAIGANVGCHNLSTANAGVFLVRRQVESHQNVVMRDGLHVFDVIFKP